MKRHVVWLLVVGSLGVLSCEKSSPDVFPIAGIYSMSVGKGPAQVQLSLHIRNNLDADFCIAATPLVQPIKLLSIRIERDAFDAYHIRALSSVDTLLAAAPDLPGLLLGTAQAALTSQLRGLEYLWSFCRLQEGGVLHCERSAIGEVGQDWCSAFDTCSGSTVTKIDPDAGPPDVYHHPKFIDRRPCLSLDQGICSLLSAADELTLKLCLLGSIDDPRFQQPICDILQGVDLAAVENCLGLPVLKDLPLPEPVALPSLCEAIGILDKVVVPDCSGGQSPKEICDTHANSLPLPQCLGIGPMLGSIGGIDASAVCRDIDLIKVGAPFDAATLACGESRRALLFDLACCKEGAADAGLNHSDAGGGGGTPMSPEDSGSGDCTARSCPSGEACCLTVAHPRCYDITCLSCCPL